MTELLYTGLREATLAVLRASLQHASLVPLGEGELVSGAVSLGDKSVLLIGEETPHPVRVAQEAYAKDRNISILLLNDQGRHQQVKQALQFAPFVGPTIQAVSGGLGAGLVPIVQDAIQRTAQRRSYAALKASSTATAFSPNHMEKVRVSYMTRVLDEAPIGAALLGSNAAVLNVNSYIVRLLGLSDQEILGVPLYAHFQGKEREALQDFINDGYHAQNKRTFELVQGEERKYLEISVGDIDASSHSPYKLVIVNDVTASTQAQQRTLAHLEELQKLNEELKRVNEDLDTFVYTASHDLKSPILNIEGLVSLLEEGLGPEHTALLPELQHIRNSVARFKNTIEDLTEVARIQRSFEQEVTQLQVAEAVHLVTQLLEAEIRSAGACIELDCASAPSLVFSKKNFHSILLNLVSNAVKYRAPERPPHVRIRTDIRDGFFRLSVQDNGLGIPAGRQDKVFQLFKRMHAHVEGSGVGLFIVKRIADNTGGQVRVQSEEGVGTTLEVLLPLPAASAP